MAEAVLSSTGDVSVALLPPATRFSARGGDSAIAALGRGFGVRFPVQACRAATQGSRAALWLGPDEWLLLAPAGEAAMLADAMTRELDGLPASIVEISDRNLGIEVTGVKAADSLNAFNALDLHDDAFPVGMCTRTLFGKAEIMLWRMGLETWRIELWRSFGPYVLGCLEEACRD